jgi:hypothetical protein
VGGLVHEETFLVLRLCGIPEIHLFDRHTREANGMTSEGYICVQNLSENQCAAQKAVPPVRDLAETRCLCHLLLTRSATSSLPAMGQP